MYDPTETARREMVAELNAVPGSREALTAQYGQVYDTGEMLELYEVTGFLAPFVRVRRRADGVKGLMTFQHSPRFYFDFTESA